MSDFLPGVAVSTLRQLNEDLTTVLDGHDIAHSESSSLQTACMHARNAVIAYNELEDNCSISTLIATIRGCLRANTAVESALHRYMPAGSDDYAIFRDPARRQVALAAALAAIPNDATKKTTASRARWAEKLFVIVSALDAKRPELMNLASGSGNAGDQHADYGTGSAVTAAIVTKDHGGGKPRAHPAPSSETPPPAIHVAPRSSFMDEGIQVAFTANGSDPTSAVDVSDAEAAFDMQTPVDETAIAMPGRGIGRIRFDAPPGTGPVRYIEGVRFTYDVAAAAWVDESKDERRARIDAVVDKTLADLAAEPTQPWQLYLPVPASMQSSHLLATTILGNYEDVTGTNIPQCAFEVRPAPPLLGLAGKECLRKMMSPLWRGSDWAQKVLGTAENVQSGELWCTISAADAPFSKDRASWLKIILPESAGGADVKWPSEEFSPAEPRFDPETDLPISRFADAAEALKSKAPPAVKPKEPRDYVPGGLIGGRHMLVLGPAGTGKSYRAASFVKWARWYYEDLQVFEYSAAGLSRDRRALRGILEQIEKADAKGLTCLLVCDEAQHLEASDFEAMKSCSILLLLGDVRQTGSTGCVPPLIAFAHCIGATVSTMDRVWRASSTNLFNAMSLIFYNSAFTAIGRGDGKVDAPIFRYETCPDDAETIAALCWALAREFVLQHGDRRSLMIAIEREDVRAAISQIAGCDLRKMPVTERSVFVTSPSQFQGLEADVVLMLCDEAITAYEDMSQAVRHVITIIGRPREEMWLIFSKSLKNFSRTQAVAASLIRSILDFEVTGALGSSMENVPEQFLKVMTELGLTLHEHGRRVGMLGYRGKPIAVAEWGHEIRDEIDNQLISISNTKKWLRVIFRKDVIRFDNPGGGTIDTYEQGVHEIGRRKATIDKYLGTGRLT